VCEQFADAAVRQFDRVGGEYFERRSAGRDEFGDAIAVAADGTPVLRSVARLFAVGLAGGIVRIGTGEDD